jgi:hypothetical protein
MNGLVYSIYGGGYLLHADWGRELRECASNEMIYSWDSMAPCACEDVAVVLPRLASCSSYYSFVLYRRELEKINFFIPFYISSINLFFK